MKKYRFLLCLAALLTATFLLASCGAGITLDEATEDPQDVIEEAFGKLSDDIDAKYGKMFNVFENAEDGKSELDVSVSVPDALNVSLKLNSDAEAELAAGKLTFGAEGINAEASVWAKDETVVLSVPALLGEGKYGVNLATLAEDIKTAPVLSTLGITYDDLKNELGVDFDELLGSFKTNQLSEEDIEKYKDTLTGVSKDLTPTVLEETVGETDVITIAYTYDKDSAKKLVEAVFDILDDLPAGTVNFLGDPAELKAELLAQIDEEYTPVDVKYYIVKKDGRILKLDVTSDAFNAKVDFSTDPAAPLEIKADLSAKDEDGTTDVVTVVLDEAEADGKKSISVTLANTYTEDGEEITSESVVSVSLDKDDALRFEMKQDGEVIFTASGSLKFDDKSFELAIDSIEPAGEDKVELEYKIKLTVGGDFEITVPEYKNILNLTEDDLTAILEEMSNSPLGSLLFGSSTEEDAWAESYDDVYGEDYYYDDYDDYGEDYDEDYDYYYDDYEEDTAA